MERNPLLIIGLLCRSTMTNALVTTIVKLGRNKLGYLKHKDLSSVPAISHPLKPSSFVTSPMPNPYPGVNLVTGEGFREFTNSGGNPYFANYGYGVNP